VNQERILQLDRLRAAGQMFYESDRERIEAYIPTLYPSNHGSSLVELDNGDLLCVWFSGSDEGSGDIKVLMSRLNHEASQWSSPVQLTDDYTRAEQNPSLFQAPDGKLWLVYTAMETRGCSLAEWKDRLADGSAAGPFAMQHTAQIRCRISADRGHTWGQVQTLFDRPGSFCRHPISVLSNGDWIFGVWYSLADGEGVFGSDYSAVHISTDQGQTWAEHLIPGSKGRVHPSIVEMGEGRLVVFFRSRSADRIYRSQSDDFGRIWTPPAATALPNNNASIRAVRLISGHIALVFNHTSASDDPNGTIWPYERCPVTIAISEDGGETWPYMRHVDTGENFCGENNKALNRRYEYPCLIQTRDGLLHIAYSYRTRVCIKHVCISERWVFGEAVNWPWQNFPYA